MSSAESLIDALARDGSRHRRAVTAAGGLHYPVAGKCREDGKRWPCPTDTALRSGLEWDGREGPAPLPEEPAEQARRDKAHVSGHCDCFPQAEAAG